MLSICITCLNDNDELERTVQDIRGTAGDRPEIVIIDDASDKPVYLRGEGIQVRRNPQRMGVAASRDLAVQIAKNPYVMLTDAHMRFEPEWYDNIIQKLSPDTAWCGACLGLSVDNMDLTQYKGEYNGARLALYEENEGKTPTIFEGKWIAPNQPDGAEVQCFMGACYFVPRGTYLKVGGLGMLRQWGSDEPYLSTKLWLAGCPIKLAKDVRIGHMFRKAAPYKTLTWSLIYNKLRAFMELFDHETYQFIRSQFPQSPPLMQAVRQLMADESQISLARKRYGGIFKEDIRWLCERFDIHHPLDYARLHLSSTTGGVRRAANRFVSAGLRSGPDAGRTADLVAQGV